MNKLNRIIAIVVILIGILIPQVGYAQKSKLPSKLYFTGNVSYDFNEGKAQNVKCYLDLNISGKNVSGNTNYSSYDGSPIDVMGTVKSSNNGKYYIEVSVWDNSDCTWKGYYNPKTGQFSGQFRARNMKKSYPFTFKKK